MSIVRISERNKQSLITLGLWVSGLLAAWMAGHWIAEGQTTLLAIAAAGVVVCVIAVAILNNWRSGFYIFLIWLLFEDLIRKFLGNNMIIYFAKDALVGITYVSFLFALKRSREVVFRPAFLFWLAMFFWLAVAQAFNPFSPSVLYGVLGLKIDFYYAPLLWIGYALIRDEVDLRRFLAVNMALAIIIAGLGIVQSIAGPSFLNPQTLAPDIRELSTLYRYAPTTGQSAFRPSSVFVSDGRFALFISMMWIVGAGALGFALLRGRKGWLLRLIYAALALLAVATVQSGSRGTLIEVVGSTLVIAAGFLWGAPLKVHHGNRLIKATRRLFLLGGLAVFFMLMIYPQSVGARLNIYEATLTPNGQYSELRSRGWNYPLENLKMAFSGPHWIIGNGLGTTSLGVQYVVRILKAAKPAFAVESGWGNLLLELGVAGLALWLMWTLATVLGCWKIARALKQTPYFPLAFAIFWFVFLLLVPLSYNGLDPFQNFVSNAYLWTLIGILFRLPKILIAAPGKEVSVQAS